MSQMLVFCGPSLPAGTVARWLPAAKVFGPVERGDVYRATAEGAVAIGIIDGCGDRPSVECQELLWALSHGVHVYGAGGIGALRAAELDRFGMIGVGRVFISFRDGSLNADDEITVVHGSAEQRYRASSEALVNIRASLERAVTKWVISEKDMNALVLMVRTQFYAMRTYPDMLELARQKNVLPGETLTRLGEWLNSTSEAHVDQKRIDAEAMIRRMASARHDGRRERPGFEFQRTEAWEEFTRELAAAAHPGT
ncbi:MAG TPA: TfuA-like protein [Polyangiales bacterium]|nr:TfuA-like protein [Polyangiales bacterium]